MTCQNNQGYDALRDSLETQLVGKVKVSFSPDDFARHARDFSYARDMVSPLAVAYPNDVDQVSVAVSACAGLGVPVVVQGGLTGMAGGAVPSDGCLIVSLERLRGVEEIDIEAATMTVRAGTPLQVVQEAAAEADMMFALDLGARGSCTIGGNIATNAGGNRVLRFGMMRDLVLGIEVVLADGTIVSGLNKMLKNNAGYDLKNLFIGSEGSLGIVTRAVLRLHPAPRSTCTALCAVADFPAVLSLLKLARARLGATLSAFEVMWQDFYGIAVSAVARPPLDPGVGHLFVLLDTLGTNPDVDAVAFNDFLEAALESGTIVDAAIAQSTSDATALWSIRDASGELPRLWGPCINFDISVPIGSMEAFVAAARERLSEVVNEEDVLVFGHVADSNLHFSCRDASGTRKQAIEAALYATVRDWSGSVSAEHGIGSEKRDYLSYSRSAPEIALMQRLKQALDPESLFNPGKILPAGNSQ